MGIKRLKKIFLILKRKLTKKRQKRFSGRKQSTCKITPVYDGFRLSFGNAQHIGKREEQQDCFAVSDNNDTALTIEKGVLAVLADGMGGIDNGREASNFVVSAMMRYFVETPFLLSVPSELRDMVESTNNDLLDYLSETGDSKGGSTLAAVIIKDSRLFWISVGDSRIYLYRNNRLYTLNRDHAYGNELFKEVIAGKITLEEALRDPDRRALTSYMGISKLTVIDQNIKSFSLLPGDKLLLCSDGVYGSINEEEITETMNLEAEAAALELEKRVLRKCIRNQDNITAVVIGFD